MKNLTLDIKILENQEEINQLQKGEVVFITIPLLSISDCHKGLGMYIGDKKDRNLLELNNRDYLEFVPISNIQTIQRERNITSFPMAREMLLVRDGGIYCRHALPKNYLEGHSDDFPTILNLLKEVFKVK